MSEKDRDEILSRKEWRSYTIHTIMSRKELDQELSKIKTQGYSTENGEYKIGLRSVAAPIFDGDNNVRYAIGLISVDRQLETEQFEQHIQVVLETAKKISEVIS